MKYLNKFDTLSDYQESASTLDTPNVCYITATTQVIYNLAPKAYITFADSSVGRKCATLYGDGIGCTEADLGAVTALNANDWKGNSNYRQPYTSFDELEYFTGITSIPNNCFDYSPSLTSVTIPSGVTSIGHYAFYESPLESITFMSTTCPTYYTDNQVTFHDQALDGNITVPSGSEANFYDLARTLGSGWTVNNLTPPAVQYVQFDDPLVESKCATLYGDGTGCTMADLSAVTAISASDWSGTNIASFDEFQYFSGLTEIPDSLFEQCRSLSSVTLPSTVTGMGEYVFDSCASLTSITIPNSVTEIGYQIFYGCESMTSAVIGNGVESITEGTFEGCTGLTSVTLGSSVQEIHTNSFFECTSLSAITIPEYVDWIDSEAFSGCTSLSSITFVSDTPPSLVEPNAFSDLSVTGDITVPVGSERDYSEIARNIGPDWTVNGQPPLEPYVEFEDPLVEEKCATLYGDVTGCTETDLAAVTALTASDWQDTDITSFNELEYFTGLERIPAGCFSACTYLEEVIIPASVNEIYYDAFMNCVVLNRIEIPDGVEIIGNFAFCGCANMESASIPSSVVSIGTSAFKYCSSLADIYFNRATLPVIGSNAFDNLPTTGNITVPDGDESNFYAFAQSLGSGWTVNEQTPS